MYKKISVVLLLVLIVPLFAGAKIIGPNVSEYRGKELKWEDGAYGYYVMFKSLLENKNSSSGNPQGDTCMSESAGSTYTLDASHIPTDAYVYEAYLIWAAAQPIAGINDVTDNEVTLKYTSTDGTITETQIVKGKKAYKINEFAEFEYDSFRDTDKPNHSYYTYRVDATEFFKNIHDKGRSLGLEYDGYSLYGNYTLSDLTCATDSSYSGSTEMLAGWTIVIVYTSIEISPKKIYLYDGFKPYWHEQQEVSVTGFEFPTEPEVRITLVTHEGDPNLYEMTNPNGGPAIPEGLQVQGDQVGWLLLSNECNPEVKQTQGMNELRYTEIYNSISSVYGWADMSPTCIGGTPPVWDYEEIEYGMDVDTFVMNTANDGSYASHFQKGGQIINLRIGANQDQVITNFMIVSVDTKAPKFDIPAHPEKVACTPANIPVNPYNPETKWCEGKVEHTFAIRVQNWGDDTTPAVIVRDTIPKGMEYVPGSTEYANEFNVVNEKQIAKKWIKIPDNGGFPLEAGFKVADKMDFCPAESDYLSCSDLIMVRFRATVKSDTKKHEVLENVATIDSTGLTSYKTNLGLPLKLKLEPSSCVGNQEEVNLDDCGGEAASGCEKDEDCGEGFVCDQDDKTCIPDPDIKRCSNSEISFSIGKNSPVCDANSSIFILSPQENLVIGQIEVLKTSSKECYFNLASLQLKFELSDNNVQLSNIKLINDLNGDGIVDSGDKSIGSSDLKDGYASFASSDPNNRLWGNKKNNLLFVLDASYKDGETIRGNSEFFIPSIDDGGIKITDDGKTKISGLPISMSKFQFEPDVGFIITKGPKDPTVPAKADMNKTHDIMQLKVISKGGEDKIKSLTIKAVKFVPDKDVTFQTAKLGSGINNISIYEDKDGDGKGDTKVITAASTDTSDRHTFKIDIPVEADKTKYYTVRATLSLNDSESFKLQVSNVAIDSDNTVLGTPIDSKGYAYVCDSEYEECGSEEDGCSCSVVSTSDNTDVKLIATTIAAFLIAFALFFRKHLNNN